MPRITGSRWDVIARLIKPSSKSVLDFGCRGRELRQYLSSSVLYVGADLQSPADVIASAEARFPFRAAAFDEVILADVLEHLDRPHDALDEAMRVAKLGVVVLLPNVLTLFIRLSLALGRVPGKYELQPQATRDRHRWLMNFDQAARFTAARAHLAGWHVAESYAYDYPFRRRSARFAYYLARQFGDSNLWAWEYAARVEPDTA